MCGIIALVGLRRSTKDLVSSIRHRGPDTEGSEELDGGRVQLAHTLLATLDAPEHSWQPRWDRRRRVCVTYNGFLSNRQMLRSGLARRGHPLRTATDTELIAELLAERGPSALTLLDGMFALVAYEYETGRVFYARDPAGIKPLYLRTFPEGIALASETGPLLGLGPARVDAMSVLQAVSFRYAVGERSGVKELRRVRPGEVGLVERDGTQRFLPSLSLPDAESGGEGVNAERAWRVVEQAARSHTETPGRVAIAFSSGVDSTTLATVLRDEPIVLVSLTSSARSAKSERLDDRWRMERLAKHLGHRWMPVESDAEPLRALQRTGEVMGEPFCDVAALATEDLARACRASGLRVILSGHGSDELFGGYRHHVAAHYGATAPFPAFRLRPVHRGDLERVRILAAARPQDRHSLLACWLAPDRMREVFSPAVLEESGGAAAMLAELRTHQRPERDPLRRSMRFDLEVALPGQMLAYSDRIFMRYGIENRVPFLQRDVIRLSRRARSSQLVARFEGKRLLRDGLRSALGSAYDSVARKRGFGVPLYHTLRRERREAADILFGSRARASALWSPTFKREILRARVPPYRVAAALMIEGWLASTSLVV